MYPSNVSNAEAVKKNQRSMALIFLIRIWILIEINFQIDSSKIGFYFITCTLFVNFFYEMLNSPVRCIDSFDITFHYLMCNIRKRLVDLLLHFLDKNQYQNIAFIH